jgi:hypothetical protein
MLLKEWRAGLPDALDRIRRRHPKFGEADHAAISAAKFLLNDAQLVLAREYGFSNWAEAAAETSRLLIPNLRFSYVLLVAD